MVPQPRLPKQSHPRSRSSFADTAHGEKFRQDARGSTPQRGSGQAAERRSRDGIGSGWTQKRRDALRFVAGLVSPWGFPASSNGRTEAFGASYQGSNPCVGTRMMSASLRGVRLVVSDLQPRVPSALLDTLSRQKRLDPFARSDATGASSRCLRVTGRPYGYRHIRPMEALNVRGELLSSRLNPRPHGIDSHALESGDFFTAEAVDFEKHEGSPLVFGELR